MKSQDRLLRRARIAFRRALQGQLAPAQRFGSALAEALRSESERAEGMSLGNAQAAALCLDSELAEGMSSGSAQAESTAQLAAWQLALRLVRYLSENDAVRPASSEVERVARAAANDEAGELVLELAERAALLEGRVADCKHLLAVHEALWPASIGLRVGQYAMQVVGGRREPAEDETELARTARTRSVALAIEVIAFRALRHLNAGDLAQAARDARRALMMARTEELSLHRRLAGLVLARVRRYDGRLHLSMRVLGSLEHGTATPWRAWLDWERCLLGEAETSTQSSLSSAASSAERGSRYAEGWGSEATPEPARALTDAIDALCRGDMSEFDAARARCESALAPFTFMKAEFQGACFLIDPRPTLDAAPDTVREFSAGDIGDVPLGLSGLARTDDSGPGCVVLLRAGQSSRRLLHHGAIAARQLWDSPCLSLSRMRQGRVDSGLAALALAGKAQEHELFHTVYGFPYDDASHAKALSVLLVRMRDRLEGVGRVVRAEQHLGIQTEGNLLLPDPRVSDNVEARLLAILARAGSMSVREVTRELGVSTRLVQLAFQRLQQAGECSADRAGRRISYSICDETYSASMQR